MKDELDRKIMKEVTTLRTKTYRYLTDNNNGGKKAKTTKKVYYKKKLKLKDYKNCLKATQLKINQLEINKAYTEILRKSHKKQ